MGLTLFSLKDFNPIYSVISRSPFLNEALQAKEALYYSLMELEKASKVSFMERKSNTKEIYFKDSVEKLTLSGNFIPGSIKDLSFPAVKIEDIGAVLTEDRLIINWNLDKIDLIYGGEKGFIETLELNFEELSKIKGVKKFFQLYQIDEHKFLNFSKAFPLTSRQNYYIESLLYGLILEKLVSRIDTKNKKWRNVISEIILTGEFPFIWQNYTFLISLLGSALGLSQRYEFILDEFNYFNSENLDLIEETAEIVSYIYIPKELRNFKHVLISDENALSDLIIEDNKIRVIEIFDKEFLEVSGIGKSNRTKIDLRGNLLFLDTRDIDYVELINVAASSPERLINQYKDWERGMDVKYPTEERKLIDMNLPGFVYESNAIFSHKINSYFDLSVFKGDVIKKGEELGTFKKKSEKVILDLSSPFDIFEDFNEYLTVVEGQLVNRGQEIAVQQNFIGKKTKTILSPSHGKIILKNIENGIVEIDSLLRDLKEVSKISGKISNIIPGKEILIEARAYNVSLFETVGKNVEGEIIFDFEKNDLNGKILFFEENTLSLYNLRKLLQIGLKGIIFESINLENFKKLNDYLLKTELDFAIAVLAGFGELKIRPEMKKKMALFESHPAILDAEDHLLKIYFSGEEKFPTKKEIEIEVGEFRIKQSVVARDFKNWGAHGKILSIEKDDALVQLDEGKVELISLYNLD